MQARWEGMTLDYDVLGYGQEVVVLLPALGMDRRMWWPQVEEFAEHYILLPIDTGGHDPVDGSADGPSLARLAEAVVSVLDAVGIEHAHVVGISMGGMIAQHLAATHQSRVRSLVLISTTPMYPTESREQLEQRATEVLRDGMETVTNSALQRWFTSQFITTSSTVVERIRRILLDSDPRSYAAGARAVANVDTVSLLERISSPTLLIRADGDHSLPVDAFQLLSLIPASRIAHLEHASHLCAVEAADQCNALIRDFWSSLSAHESWPDSLSPLSPW